MTATLEAPEPVEVAVPDRPRHFLRGKGLVGLVLVGLVIVTGLLGPLLVSWDPYEQIPGANLLGPSGTHLLGTDDLNRDILARLVTGIRVDLLIAFTAVPVGALVGCAVGALATVNSVLDVAVQRLFDVLLAFPQLILAIGLAAVIGPGTTSVVIVIVCVEIPVFGRLLRAAVLRVREAQFVTASEVIGAGKAHVLRHHVLPNSLEPILVQLALSLSVAVFIEGAMSVLGIGVSPPHPSIGSVLTTSLRYLDLNPLFAIGPLAVTAVLVLGFQLIAQAANAARGA
ncbi:ABC transporter permease [Actinokineospora globicatena]|uniref:Diguanylate cyclase n=1 Tax=Actinokineospora globicatena TaxID=103729 RepID=A0A9W6QPB7_9PSEU|nr:ABC transporter permease [Actinokineospora globicatena]MCP2305832.1 peptide/nickel transport system permease protein [Actinokineospora globicatena]GLW80303.1 diguanylate cyclase [Actinokineospora globicatena]GLW87131.1 diguanylate cyclase [Actinokineospora globicatena]GLW93495.1 diguanylate cyclase [Actinokineospora globicatena]